MQMRRMFESVNRTIRASQLRADAQELARKGFPGLSAVASEMAEELSPTPREVSDKDSRAPRHTKKDSENRNTWVKRGVSNGAASSSLPVRSGGSSGEKGAIPANGRQGAPQRKNAHYGTRAVAWAGNGKPQRFDGSVTARMDARAKKAAQPHDYAPRTQTGVILGRDGRPMPGARFVANQPIEFTDGGLSTPTSK